MFRFLFILIAIAPLVAQTPFLVDDLVDQTVENQAHPSEFVTMGGDAYFTAREPGGWDSLWKTDGSVGGTVRVIHANQYGSIRIAGASDDTLALHIGSNPNRQYWLFDGTPGGLTSIPDPVKHSDFSPLAAYFDGFWLFTGLRDHGVLSYEVATDTLTTLNAFSSAAFHAAPNGFFFADRDGVWFSNGRLEGTYRLPIDVIPGQTFSLSGKTYFFKNSDLYVSDGSPDNTREIGRFDAVATVAGKVFVLGDTDNSISVLDASDNPVQLMVNNKIERDLLVSFAGEIWFAVEEDSHLQLWHSDGTVEGTLRGPDLDFGSINSFVATETFLLLEGNFGLWASDGTQLGTRQVFSERLDIKVLGSVGGRAFFSSSNSGLPAAELLVSDGQEAGTGLFAKLSPAAPAHEASSTVVAVANAAVYLHEGRVKAARNDGSQPWVLDDQGIGSIATDGASLFLAGDAGTSALRRREGLAHRALDQTYDINAYYPPNLNNGYVWRGELYFSKPHGHYDLNQPNSLYRTDGAQPDPIEVTRYALPAFVQFSPIGEQLLYFTADADLAWAGFTDGSIIDSGWGYFGLSSGENGTALDGIVGDGTQAFVSLDAGTHLVMVSEGQLQSVPMQSRYLFPRNLTAVALFQGKAWFPAYDSTHGWQLWTTDGTEQGLEVVTSLYGGVDSSVAPVVFGNRLYFSGSDGVHGYEVYSTDGTPGGEQLLTDLAPGSQPALPRDFLVVGNKLFFCASNGSSGGELFQSDGTVGGTALVSDLQPGFDSSFPSDLTAVGDTVYFTAFTRERGRALYGLRSAPNTTIHTVAEACAGGEAEARVQFISEATNYQWSLTGASLTSGQGTHVITYIPDGGSNVTLDVSVTDAGVNAVGSVTLPTTSVSTGAVGAISGPDTACHDTLVDLWVVPVVGVSQYQWMLPEGMVIAQGQGTANVRVAVGNQGGEIQVAAVGGCGLGPASTFSLAVIQPIVADAGEDRYFCSLTGNLSATPVSGGAGYWTALGNGIVHEPENPFSPITLSQYGWHYFKWTVTPESGCSTHEDFVEITWWGTIRLPDAGPDRLLCQRSLILQGSGNGRWEVVSGEGSHFEDPKKANSRFSGKWGETYVLRLTFDNGECSSASDEVTLSFAAPFSVDLGSDRCITDGEALPLQGQPNDANGLWEVASGPSLEMDQFSPTPLGAIFSPGGGPGEYLIRYTATAPTTPTCGVATQTVLINVQPSPPQAVTLVDLVVEGGEVFDGAPRDGVAWRGRFYYSATSPLFGRELMSTDGTQQGTFRLTDIWPGTNDGYVRGLTATENYLFFFGADGRSGIGLWRSDGTREGTQQVLVDSPLDSYTSGLFPAGDKVFFSNAGKLWTSDGHASNTFVVAEGNGIYLRGPLVADGDRIIFQSGVGSIRASNGVNSLTGAGPGTLVEGLLGENWFSLKNGLVYSHGAGSSELLVENRSMESEGAQVLGNHLIFKARTGSTGEEAWISDGTAANTRLLVDLNPGAGDGFTPGIAVLMGDNLLLGGPLGLWRTDLNGHAPVLLLDEVIIELHKRDEDLVLLVAENGNGYLSDAVDVWPVDVSLSPGDVLGVGDGFYFSGRDEEHGEELMFLEENGSSRRLLDTVGFDPSITQAPVVSGERVFFRNPEGLLMSSSFEGPHEVVAGPDSGKPIAYNGGVVFAHDDGTGLGKELWFSDGTMLGTSLLVDIQPGAGSSDPDHFIVYEGTLYFAATGPEGRKPWRSDGTEAGTFLFYETAAGEDGAPTAFAVDGDLLWFTTFDGQVWQSDGASAITEYSLYGDHQQAEIFVYGERLFIWYQYESYNWRWRTFGVDGSYSGYTNVAGPIPPVTAVSGDRILFIDEEGRLKVVEGNSRTTLLDSARSLISHEGRVWFNGYDPQNGWELWQSDGTLEGTLQATEQVAGTGSLAISRMLSHGEKLYMVAATSNADSRLQFYDGGCLVQADNPSPGMELYSELVSDGDRVFATVYMPDGSFQLRMLEDRRISLPDVRLRSRVLLQYDSNADGFLDRDEAEAITMLDVSGLGITNISGIEVMPQLETLLADENYLTEPEPLLAHDNLGYGASHYVDISYNYFTEDECDSLQTLEARALAAGATLIYEDQLHVIQPTPDLWPQVDIGGFILGVVEEWQLNCP